MRGSEKKNGAHPATRQNYKAPSFMLTARDTTCALNANQRHTILPRLHAPIREAPLRLKTARSRVRGTARERAAELRQMLQCANDNPRKRQRSR